MIELLLNKGAIPTLKTDIGETPLQILQRWRASNILERDDELLYNNICNKMLSSMDKTNTSDSVLNRSKSPIITLRSDISPSTSMSCNKKQPKRPDFKNRNVIDDDSDDDLDSSQNNLNQITFPNESNDDGETEPNKHSKSESVYEYKNVISALRNRCINDLPEVDVIKPNHKAALLDSEEVDDDWLDDDLNDQTNKSKKRKIPQDPLAAVSAKRPSYDSIKDTVDNINKYNEPLLESNINYHKPKTKLKISNVIDVSENSSDSEPLQTNENLKETNNELFQNTWRDFNKTLSRDSRENIRKRWKRQSTLLRAGFQRKRVSEHNEDCSSNSASDNEFSSNINKNSSAIIRPKNDNRNLNAMGHSSTGHDSASKVVQPLNILQPISIIQPVNSRGTVTQIMSPAAVKVKIEDKILLISLNLSRINKLTISWLVEEVKSRYCK